MLKKLLDTMAGRPGHEPGTLWTYRFSGNTLELLVLPDHLKDPENYRLGVIEIGRVIQGMESGLSGSGRILHAQSFPNLGESRLAALVRLNRIYGSGISNGQESGVDTTGLKERLRSLALQFGLSIRPDGRNRASGSSRNGSEPEVQTLFLCSAIDNPFIWLKTGRWMEAASLRFSAAELHIDPCLTQQQRDQRGDDDRYCNYVQATVNTSP